MLSISSTLSKLSHIEQKLNLHIPKELSNEELEQKHKMENSFYEFVKGAWHIIEGGRTFIPGWHIEVIAAHLEALKSLQIQDLLINIPFRTGKSNLVSVLYCAWVWTTEPYLRFLYISFAQTLSDRDSVRCKRLIQSDWYQKYWGHQFHLMADMNNKRRFDNSKQGFRIASSISGSNTGEGGDFQVLDDPNNMSEVRSDIVREDVNFTFDFTLASRYILLETRRRLVIQQRGHEHELSGHILGKKSDSWVHLCLPMEFEKSRRCITVPLAISNNKPWTDPRTKEGELLWPQGVNAERLFRMKKDDFGGDEYIISGQLQQRPAPASGGIFKKDWLNYYKEEDLPNFEFTIQSWDTALTSNKNNCQSSCTTWGIFRDSTRRYNVMLLSLYTGWLEGPELRMMAKRLANNYEDTEIDYPATAGLYRPPHRIVVEAKANGLNVVQELHRASVEAIAFNPTRYGDKVNRARLMSGIFKNKLVWLQTAYPDFEDLTDEAEEFLSAITIFPNGKTNDIVDSTSQAFICMRELGYIFHRDEEMPKDPEPWKTHQKPYY